MKRHLLLSAVFMIGMNAVFSQQKINDGTVGGNSINGNAILELESANKGLLHSRVALSSTAEAIPLSAHVAGMMVYNTATANDVVPGIYYNNGARWVLIGPSAWSIIHYNPITNEITYIDENGDTQVIDLDDLAGEDGKSAYEVA